MAESGRRTETARGANQTRSPFRQQLRSYLEHHRKVARDSAARLLKNPVSSGMTWAVMGVALALPVALLLLLASFQGVSEGWESGARITAYLAEEVTAEEGRQQAEALASDSRIAAVEFVDRAQALAEFRVSSGLEEALDYLEGNPLPHTLLVTPDEGSRTSAGVETLVSFVRGQPGVARVQVDLGWLQRLNAITDLLARAVWALALLLAAAVVLVIGNTVRLAIENRRDEILVARLVGGTDAFVRRPFLYTGAWFGLGGGLVAWLLLQLGLWWLSGPVGRLADLYHSSFTVTGLGVGGGLALIACGTLLGWLGAWLAVKRHLADIEPGEAVSGG